jgi:hypothetical protein
MLRHGSDRLFRERCRDRAARADRPSGGVAPAAALCRGRGPGPAAGRDPQAQAHWFHLSCTSDDQPDYPAPSVAVVTGANLEAHSISVSSQHRKCALLTPEE